MTTQPRQSSVVSSAIGLVGASITMLTTFVIARVVFLEGSEFAGIFFSATAVVSVLGTVASLGTAVSLVFHMPQATESESYNPRSLIWTALRPVLFASLSLGAILFLLASPIASLITSTSLNADQVADALRLLAPAVPAWAVTLTLMGASRGLGSIVPTVAVSQIFRPLGQLALVGAVMLGIDNPKPWHVAIAWSVPVLLGTVIAGAAVVRLDGLSGTFTDGPVETEAFWRYTRKGAVSTSLQIALERLDVVIVAALLGEGSAGIYGALSRFATAGNFLIFSVAQAVSPHLRRLIKTDDLPGARRLFQNAAGWMTLVTWPYLLLMATKHDLFARLIGEENVPESGLLIIMAAAIMMSAASGPVELGVNMLGRPGANLVTTAAAFATDIVLLLVLAPQFGLRGAAIAWGTAVVVKNASAGWLAFSSGGLQGPGLPVLVAGLGALVAVVPVGLSTNNSFVALPIIAAIAGPVLLGWIAVNRQRLGIVRQSG